MNTLNEQSALIISNTEETAEALQARFQQWGYLYFKRYINKDKCQNLLSELLDQLKPYVVLNPTSALPVLTGQPFVETDPIWDEVYPKIQSLETFHAFFHDEHVLDLMKKIAGTDVFVYPMKMARISTPGKIGYETPPHQDARSHAAGPTMAGMWVALHDITSEMGRLKILPASHKNGVRPVVSSLGVGNVQCKIYPEEKTWHVSDVEQGDVIVFHSATVHAAQANISQNIVRMSVDTRFCDYGAPVSSINLDPHHAWRIQNLNWNEIYKSWKNKNLQYYWKNYPHLF